MSPTPDPDELRILATLLAMPEEGALDVLREVQPMAPWLEPSLAELAQIPLEHWQAEYTRLFVSDYPKVPCPPYESAYRQGTMGGTSASELVGLYRRAGLQASEAAPDYLGTILECAAYLREQSMDELLSELMEEHIARWVPRFARDLQEQAALAFYRELGVRLARLFPPPAHD